VDVELLRYQMNIVSFLRMHPAVAGGIAPVATKHFDQLIRSLATLNGLDYVSPALVGLAARKIYLHRIRVVSQERERSMQWGSELAAVEQMLDGVGPEDIIEDVLGVVEVPL
jgi:MoxR-like ATPase